MKTIKVYEMVGENCTTLEDGQNIYNAIYPELKAGRDVKLDFSGTRVFASPFFNGAVGQLLKDIPFDELRKILKVANLPDYGQETMSYVIDNAKRYYSDARIPQFVEEILTTQAEDI